MCMVPRRVPGGRLQTRGVWNTFERKKFRDPELFFSDVRLDNFPVCAQLQ